MSSIEELAGNARLASRDLAVWSSNDRERALSAVAEALNAREAEIIEANRGDCERAAAEGLASPLQKRLRFDGNKLAQAIEGVRSVSALEDPVGRVMERRELDRGLMLERKATPIGVIAMIFESRPDALVQIAALALKSGNAVVLKGGSEARESNRVLADIVHDAARRQGAPPGWLQLVETRRDVGELLRQDRYIDLVIPRGSNEFVRYIMDHTRIPVMGHADGVCHVYLDRDADRDVAVAVTVDAKTQYVAVCNAAETLLVHRDAAAGLLPAVSEALRSRGVSLRGCEETRKILPGVSAADESDWSAEYLDLILAVRVVESLEDAILHINTWGSGHTDAIVTTCRDRAEQFLSTVDSASVMWNASTRFADGFRYGLGAEVGISTSRIHARGPVGVEGLMSFKWVLRGRGHVVEDYESGVRAFTHRSVPLGEAADAEF